MSIFQRAENAAKTGNLEELEILYQQHGRNIRINNVFLAACEYGQVDVINWALDNGADININDGLAMHLGATFASRTDNEKVMNALIERGIELSGRAAEEFITFKIFKHDESVLSLLENPEFRTQEILESALQHFNTSVYEYLFENGVEDENNIILRRYIEQTEQYSEENEDFPEQIFILLQHARNIDFELIEYSRSKNYKLYLKILNFITEDKQPINISKNDIKNFCINEDNLYGEPIDGSEKFVIFMLQNSENGYCYTLPELAKILDPENQVYEWKGPPAPYRNEDEKEYGPMTDKPVYRLPYNGVWVKWETVINAILLARNNNENIPNVVYLSGTKKSLGSSFGVSQLHGQWGGEWAPVTEIVGSQRVPDGTAVPDEREILYE